MEESRCHYLTGFSSTVQVEGVQATRHSPTQVDELSARGGFLTLMQLALQSWESGCSGKRESGESCPGKERPADRNTLN